MSHTGINGPYEIVLGPAAVRIILSLPRPVQRKLAKALKNELSKGPNASKEVRFDSDVRSYADPDADPGEVVYTATPLSFDAYTAIHRPLTEGEIEQLRAEQGRSTVTWGFYLIDILAAESAFSRGPRVV